MFRSAAVRQSELAVHRLSMHLDDLARTGRTWFDGRPESIDTRIARMDRVIGIAADAASRLGSTEAGRRAIVAVQHLEHDRRELAAARDSLLNGFADRQAGHAPASRRTASDDHEFRPYADNHKTARMDWPEWHDHVIQTWHVPHMDDQTREEAHQAWRAGLSPEDYLKQGSRRKTAAGGTPEELWRQDYDTSVNNLAGFPPSLENERAMQHLKGRDWEEMLKRDSGTFDYSKHPLHDFGDQTRHEPFDGRPEHSQVQEWPRGSGQGWMPGNGIDSPSHLHPYHGPYTPNRRQYPEASRRYTSSLQRVAAEDLELASGPTVPSASDNFQPKTPMDSLPGGSSGGGFKGPSSGPLSNAAKSVNAAGDAIEGFKGTDNTALYGKDSFFGSPTSPGYSPTLVPSAFRVTDGQGQTVNADAPNTSSGAGFLNPTPTPAPLKQTTAGLERAIVLGSRDFVADQNDRPPKPSPDHAWNGREWVDLKKVTDIPTPKRYGPLPKEKESGLRRAIVLGSRDFVADQNTDDREEILFRARRYAAEETSTLPVPVARQISAAFVGAVEELIARRPRKRQAAAPVTAYEDFPDSLLY